MICFLLAARSQMAVCVCVCVWESSGRPPKITRCGADGSVSSLMMTTSVKFPRVGAEEG